MSGLLAHPQLNDRGAPYTSHANALADILHCAWKYDDKPHQLYRAIAKAALTFAGGPSYRDEIVRLMDKAAEG